MDLANQKLQLIEAILQCQDPKVLAALQSILALQGPQEVAPPPPWAQQSNMETPFKGQDSEKGLQQIQDDIDAVFNA